jgi:hypothetical protein
MSDHEQQQKKQKTNHSLGTSTNASMGTSTNALVAAALPIEKKIRRKNAILDLYELNMIKLKSLFGIGISEIIIDLYNSKLFLSGKMSISYDNLKESFKSIAVKIRISNSDFLKKIITMITPESSESSESSKSSESFKSSELSKSSELIGFSKLIEIIAYQNELLNEMLGVLFLSRILEIKINGILLGMPNLDTSTYSLRSMLNGDLTKFSEKLDIFKSQILFVFQKWL